MILAGREQISRGPEQRHGLGSMWLIRGPASSDVPQSTAARGHRGRMERWQFAQMPPREVGRYERCHHEVMTLASSLLNFSSQMQFLMHNVVILKWFIQIVTTQHKVQFDKGLLNT